MQLVMRDHAMSRRAVLGLPTKPRKLSPEEAMWEERFADSLAVLRSTPIDDGYAQQQSVSDHAAGQPVACCPSPPRRELVGAPAEVAAVISPESLELFEWRCVVVSALVGV